MSYRIYTLAERPELRQPISEIHWQVWLAFMGENDVANRAWPLCFEDWAEYQVALCAEGGAVLAAGNAVPITWDGTMAGLPPGWEAATAAGMQGYESGVAPNALSAYAIVVSPQSRGKGLSGLVLEAMLNVAKERGLLGVVACVRPTLKALYPLTPFGRYVQWSGDDGLAF